MGAILDRENQQGKRELMPLPVHAATDRRRVFRKLATLRSITSRMKGPKLGPPSILSTRKG